MDLLRYQRLGNTLWNPQGRPWAVSQSPKCSCQSIYLMLSITCFKGGVAKWLRRRSAKPLFPGSSPGAASNIERIANNWAAISFCFYQHTILNETNYNLLFVLKRVCFFVTIHTSWQSRNEQLFLLYTLIHYKLLKSFME